MSKDDSNGITCIAVQLLGKLPRNPKTLLRNAYLSAAATMSPLRMCIIARACLAGANPGLTMVVGPPGTGKTDVAVQMISNIYKNFPNERTLIVTHSNQAFPLFYCRAQRCFAVS